MLCVKTVNSTPIECDLAFVAFVGSHVEYTAESISSSVACKYSTLPSLSSTAIQGSHFPSRLYHGQPSSSYPIISYLPFVGSWEARRVSSIKVTSQKNFTFKSTGLARVCHVLSRLVHFPRRLGRFRWRFARFFLLWESDFGGKAHSIQSCHSKDSPHFS